MMQTIKSLKRELEEQKRNNYLQNPSILRITKITRKRKKERNLEQIPRSIAGRTVCGIILAINTNGRHQIMLIRQPSNTKRGGSALCVQVQEEGCGVEIYMLHINSLKLDKNIILLSDVPPTHNIIVKGDSGISAQY